MKRAAVLLILACVAWAGCTTTQKAATAGGVGGATLGGIIGHQTGGHGVEGAAIGGAIGTVGGMIVGEKMTRKFCPVCGKQYTEDVKFCPKDGTELKLIEK